MLELYIHIPFCVQKCKYCDFLSAPADTEAKNAYMEALCKEIKERGRVYGDRDISSIFIGGGTPTSVAPEWIVRILELIHSHYRVAENAEISMEMNPGTVNDNSLRQYKQAGINRISIGLQSANNTELKNIGRIHSFQDFEVCYHKVRDAGFKNVNVDLMSALPEQTFESFKDTLESVVRLSPAPEHISVYSLILEEGTPLYSEYENYGLNLPDEDTERLMYEYTGEFLSVYGYEQYEISNYAKESFACKHNIGYWERVDYLGFGIGAASKIGNRRFSNTDNIVEYQKKPCGSCTNVQELSKCEEMEETMFLGLRMTKGVSGAVFEKNFGVSMESVYGEVIRKHSENGLLVWYEKENDRCLRLTKAGLNVSNIVMSDFLEPGLFS